MRIRSSCDWRRIVVSGTRIPLNDATLGNGNTLYFASLVIKELLLLFKHFVKLKALCFFRGVREGLEEFGMVEVGL